jgi:hypothetical protein
MTDDLDSNGEFDLNVPSAEWNITQFSLLNPNKFKVVINLFKDTAFWAQAVNMPAITMGANKMGTSRSIDFWTPGDKIEYEDLRLKLMIDRDMLAVRLLKEWQENIVNAQVKRPELYSDMTIVFLDNSLNENLLLKFTNTFPYSLSGIEMGSFNAPDAPLTMDVTFKFMNFTINPLVAPDPATP